MENRYSKTPRRGSRILPPARNGVLGPYLAAGDMVLREIRSAITPAKLIGRPTNSSGGWNIGGAPQTIKAIGKALPKRLDQNRTEAIAPTKPQISRITAALLIASIACCVPLRKSGKTLLMKIARNGCSETKVSVSERMEPIP